MFTFFAKFVHKICDFSQAPQESSKLSRPVQGLASPPEAETPGFSHAYRPVTFRVISINFFSTGLEESSR